MDGESMGPVLSICVGGGGGGGGWGGGWGGGGGVGVCVGGWVGVLWLTYSFYDKGEYITHFISLLSSHRIQETLPIVHN